MKRLKVFIFAIFVTVASGCTSNMSSSDSSVACLGEECTSADCFDQQLVSSKDGMLDFCQSPAFGTFAIEKDGITWYFGESVSYGQFVNGDYWVLDKGDGVEITKVTPGPTADRSGSMINPTVGVQAYDSRIYNFDPAQGVQFPAVLKGGDSLVSTISVMDSDLNEYGNVYPSWYKSTKGLGHASLMNASVLTVVSEVPKTGSFRPPYVGTDKKIYNIADIKKSILPKLNAPASLPDVTYFERGVERPWLMHMPGWTAREMHPVENMRNYHRDIGNFLSDLSLILLTDGATDKLLYGFIQTGIDHYYTIINGRADSATFEFHSVLTGLLLGDESMARVWVDNKSQTGGRAADKFYFPDQIGSTISSSTVKSGETWQGFKVMFRKQSGNSEHEHLHPSEWDLVENGGGRKQENYRHCCDSKPHFGMALTSRILKAKSYWPSQALDMYLDRWIWESINGYGYDVINQYYSFDPEWNGTGERKYILSSQFTDDIYLGFGFDPSTVAKPTDPSKYQAKALGELEPSVSETPENTVEESVTTDTSDSSTDDSSSSEPVISNQIEDTRVIVEETPATEASSTETSSSTVEETTTTETTTTDAPNQIEDTRVVTEETSTTGTSNQIEDTRVVTEETSTTGTSNQIEDTRVVTEETSTTGTSSQIEDTRVVTEETSTTGTSNQIEDTRVVTEETSTTGTSNQIEDTRVVIEETTTEPVTRAVEEPVVEATTSSLEEEPVVETTTRTVEEPVVESVTRTVEEEPVVEATTSSVEEEPVVETTTRTVEEPVVESVTGTVEEEPVVESPTSTVEEPVVETTTRTVEEPVVESVTRTVEEEPVVESTTSTVEEEPVAETTTRTEEASTTETSSTTSGGTSGPSTTSSNSVEETSTSDTSTRTLEESSTDETLVRTVEETATTDSNRSLSTLDETESVDLSGGTVDASVEEVAPAEEDSIKTKRSNKIKDTRGSPPGRSR